MSGRAHLSIEGPLAIISFSNPPEGFMDDDSTTALSLAIDQIEQDGSIRVVILTGAQEGVFIRHFDVRVLEARGRALAAKGYAFSADRPVPETPLHMVMRRIEASPLPYIAALNGTAMGGGFELALACDIRLAEEGPFWLGLPEANIGLLPGAGGTQRLSRLIGESRALELMLTGRTLSPSDAARMGLVSACVDGPVLDHARAIAKNMVVKPAKALAHIKRLVRGSGPDPVRMAEERTLFCDLMVSQYAITLMSEMNEGAGDIRAPRSKK
jgi:enoyl-CoA hydratase